MAVAAPIQNVSRIEQREQPSDFLQWAAELSEPASAVQLSELDDEREIPRRFAAFVGSIALEGSVERGNPEPSMSLLEAMRLAREGDPEARQMIEMNVRTDVIERSIKAGHVMKVSLGRSESGEIMQFGQRASSIQANSLKYAADSWQILGRTEAETRNMFRIQDSLDAGLLEDNYVVVLSRAADNMSENDMREAGFFVDTMSIAIQATTHEMDGRITTESAFVAGKKNLETDRNDAKMMEQLVGCLVKSSEDTGLSATELIDKPILVPKSMMRNGVIDLVRTLDDLNEGTFFGQDKPRRDYIEYLQECADRQATLEPMVQQIADELIRMADSVTSRVEATSLLGKLSGARLIERSLYDDSIDTAVFGAEAAASIAEARYWMEQGEHELATDFLDRAVTQDKSNSCPGAGKGVTDKSENGEEGIDTDCEYISLSCPLCGAKRVATTDKKLKGNRRRISGSCGCKLDYTKQ